MSVRGHLHRRRRGYLSTGAWAIVGIAVLSSLTLALMPQPAVSSGLTMWTSAREHMQMYTPFTVQWNAEAASAKQRQAEGMTVPLAELKPPIDIDLFSGDALQRRMMGGFLSDVPVADLVEVERSLIGPVFGGPLKDVGFVDLTPKLKAEGLLEQFNAPSFSPWSSRGHIFGLPHDVHPVMLAYRSDITEAAGIDMNSIQTWDDFARVTKPLLAPGPDGKPTRYPLNLWYTSIDQIETLCLQAGGQLFDENEHLQMASDINAHVIATIISWTGGPNRVSADAPEFFDSGNELRMQGYVVCSILPDWLGGVWKNDIPGLSGKLKIMPLPAWTPGGRRTSVWGGTMLGICKTSKNQDIAWAFAKHIYTSPKIAEQLYLTNDIISPLRTMWTQPFYQQPDPFFSGQVVGPMFIAAAPHVPVRPSSPYNQQAKLRLQDAVVNLRRYAEQTNSWDVATLEPQAKKMLQAAQVSVQQQIDKNVFLAGT